MLALPVLLARVQKAARGRTTIKREKETANLDHRLQGRVLIRISSQLVSGVIFMNGFTNAKSATLFRNIPAMLMLEVLADSLKSALAVEVPSFTMSAGASPIKSTEIRQCVSLSL